MSDEKSHDAGGEPPAPGERRADESAAAPLNDSAFPHFDSDAVPPRPPLPDRPRARIGEQRVREQWRTARGEIDNRVSIARGQIDQANERIKERTGRDLILAIIIGLAFGALLLVSLLFTKTAFIVIALAVALLCIVELTRALKASGRRIDLVPQMIAGGLLVLAGYFTSAAYIWIVLFVAVFFVIVWRLVAQMVAQDGRTYGDVLADALVSGLVQAYVPFLAAISLLLLIQDGGQWWVLAFIAIAVAADVGAYASGLAFGKHPMAPRISPKKTWEGFAGAVVFSIAAGVLFAMFLLEMQWWAGAILGAGILLSATLGDLAESMIKRDIGIKDMSSWLPGHGGLLDRLDSILPSTVPALCLYFLLSPWAVGA